MYMMKIFSVFLAAFSLCSCSTEEKTPIMADGIVDQSEWLDAKLILIDSSNTIYAKSDDRYYYLAIKSQLQKPFYIDLFIEESGSIKNIHASSQLGDRVLADSTWSDYEPETKWGYNIGWIANTVKFDREKMRTIEKGNLEMNPYASSFIPYDAMEFQFSKRHFNLDEAKFRIEIKNMIGPDGFRTVIFPQDSKRKQVENWTKIDFK
jgi:hypothetical protein